MKKLFESRRFMTLVLDTVVSIALHFFTGADALFLIGALQPVFLAIVVSIELGKLFGIACRQQTARGL